MQDQDEEMTELCASCGSPVQGSLERAFAFGESGVLCPACASRRGGVYDAERECWSVEPDVAGLPDDRRPHP